MSCFQDSVADDYVARNTPQLDAVRTTMQPVLGCDIPEQPVQMLLLAASIPRRLSCCGFHRLV